MPEAPGSGLRSQECGPGHLPCKRCHAGASALEMGPRAPRPRRPGMSVSLSPEEPACSPPFLTFSSVRFQSQRWGWGWLSDWTAVQDHGVQLPLPPSSHLRGALLCREAPCAPAPQARLRGPRFPAERWPPCALRGFRPPCCLSAVWVCAHFACGDTRQGLGGLSSGAVASA